MSITSAKYTDTSLTRIKAVCGGKEYSMAVSGSTWLHNDLRAWVKGGGVIDPYEAPLAAAVTSVTPRQAKLALLSAGLLDDVEAAIDAITDPATKRVAQIEWEYAQEIKRDWPLLVQLSTSMGMTSTDLDELFTQAALL